MISKVSYRSKYFSATSWRLIFRDFKIQRRDVDENVA